MSSSELLSYSEKNFDTSWPDQAKGVRVAPVSYEKFVAQTLEYHTGSAETYLKVEQEQELATLIQDGQAAQGESAHLQAEGKLDQVKQHSLLTRIKAGQGAEHKLIECNLKLSDYLARASMNILPAGDREAATAGKARKRRRMLLNDHVPRLPRSFTSLKSRHAELDDRIQIANLGLIKAARHFTPGFQGEKGEPVPFISYASMVIKTDLASYVRGGRPDAHEQPIHIPAHVLENIGQAHKDDWQLHFSKEKRDELLAIEQIQDMVSLDSLYFTGAADEERAYDDGDTSLLETSEMIPVAEDMRLSSQVIERMRRDAVYEILQTLTERDAGVVRLRFGLDDGRQRTLEEIGTVYGVRHERIRQILAQAMQRLRHPSRSLMLRDFLDVIEESSESSVRSGDIIKTERSIGRTTTRLLVVSAVADTEPVQEHADWQAYPGEGWDEPVRRTSEQHSTEYAKTADKLYELIFDASPYPFQKSFATDLQSPYPKILVDRITHTLGDSLAPAHIADFWHNHLEAFLQHLSERLGNDASPDRATQFLSRLLAERMKDDDMVELRIPNNLQGKLSYIGAWLSHGHLRVIGDPGTYAGYAMDNIGHLEVEGSVGDLAGNAMNKFANMEIHGNAGDFLGFGMKGEASISVKGNVGAYCGHRMKQNASIEIRGSTGEKLGFGALGGSISLGS